MTRFVATAVVAPVVALLAVSSLYAQAGTDKAPQPAATSAPASKPSPKAKGLTLDLLPAAVRATILKEAGDNKIAELEKISVGGKVAYEATWVVNNVETTIKVALDGEILSTHRQSDRSTRVLVVGGRMVLMQGAGVDLGKDLKVVRKSTADTMAEVCGLSDKQIAEVKALEAQREEITADFQKDNADKIEKARKAFNEAWVARDKEAGQKAEQELMVVFKPMNDQIGAIQTKMGDVLTAEQKAKWEAHLVAVGEKRAKPTPASVPAGSPAAK